MSFSGSTSSIHSSLRTPATGHALYRRKVQPIFCISRSRRSHERRARRRRTRIKRPREATSGAGAADGGGRRRRARRARGRVVDVEGPRRRSPADAGCGRGGRDQVGSRCAGRGRPASRRRATRALDDGEGAASAADGVRVDSASTSAPRPRRRRRLASQRHERTSASSDTWEHRTYRSKDRAERERLLVAVRGAERAARRRRDGAGVGRAGPPRRRADARRLRRSVQVSKRPHHEGQDEVRPTVPIAPTAASTTPAESARDPGGAGGAGGVDDARRRGFEGPCDYEGQRRWRRRDVRRAPPSRRRCPERARLAAARKTRTVRRQGRT